MHLLSDPSTRRRPARRPRLRSLVMMLALAGLGATGLWVPIITVVQRWFAFRRKGLAVSMVIIFAVAAALYVKIRRRDEEWKG